MTATSLLCRLILSSASSAFSHGRSLLQTDLTTTNPALSVCGSVVSGSDLTIGSGASVDVDTSCTYGSESWDISGTTTTYTTSGLANGNVDVQSGGLLVLSSVTGSPNAFSINGTLTLSGTMEVVVSAAGDGTTVTLMKWNSGGSCDNLTSVYVYGCSNCSTNVTYSSDGTQCYLQMTFSGLSAATADDDSDEALYFLFFLLLIPIFGIFMWMLMKKTTSTPPPLVQDEPKEYPEVRLHFDTDYLPAGAPTPVGSGGSNTPVYPSI